SRLRLVRLVPLVIGVKHTPFLDDSPRNVQQQQLASCGASCHFHWFTLPLTLRPQPLIQGFDRWVVSYRTQCCHVQGSAQTLLSTVPNTNTAPASDTASSSRLSRHRC